MHLLGNYGTVKYTFVNYEFYAQLLLPLTNTSDGREKSKVVAAVVIQFHDACL